MQSSQPGRDGFDHNILAEIPDLVRAWELFPHVVHPVRRPLTLPDPQSYHVALDPQVIFELDEKLKNGATETILVVPYSCTKCRSLKQACSRARPACARCSKSGFPCTLLEEGYQRLPPPKLTKGKGAGKTRMSGDVQGSPLPSPSVREPRAGQSRGKRIVSGSKRPLSPEYDSDYGQPRKQIQTKAPSQKRKTRRHVVVASDGMDMTSEAPISPSVQVTPTVASTTEVAERGTPTWKFVNHPHMRDGKSARNKDQAHPIPPDSPIPRVWTNSLEGLLTMFPELSKSKVGFSWLQSETPILLLDTNFARSHWKNATTLTIDLFWDFNCHDSDLESADELHPGVPHCPHSCPSTVHFRENDLGCEAEMMDLQCSHVPSMTHNTADDMECSTQLYPSCSNPSSENLPPFQPCFASNPQVNLQPRIPRIKPDEVETLLNSKLRYIPSLVWISHDSELVPCRLPQEYAYVCMGLFFISDLHHTVTRQDASSAIGDVRGQVCWNITLQWVPGGEDALFDCNTTLPSDATAGLAQLCTIQDLSNPWWFRPVGASSQDDSTIPRHPGNLRMRIFSCIPLDLLAEFRPSEVFPRGWFCRSCGMINIQQYFRHQICQSTMCESRREKGVQRGNVDPLISLRSAYQSSTLIRPTNHIPLVVVTNQALWDDGMQSWTYCVRDGVALCHVFTGNQEHLQEDASGLLERIQGEALLRKEDRSSPYFVHTTKLLHPGDGSETRVPVGTPDCVRLAYYTLCNFVCRYAEMDEPRFGEVRFQAWVNSGSKRGAVLRASKSPIVIHCLGSQVVLNLTPKGGYRDVGAVATPDKGKERAQDNGQAELLPAEPCGGPSCLLDQDREQASLIPGHGANETPTGIDETMVAGVSQRGNLDADSVVTIDANNLHRGSGMEVACHEVAKPGEILVHKKNKVVKDKNRTYVPEISMTLVHGDCVVLFGDDFEIVRFGTTILVIGFPEET